MNKVDLWKSQLEGGPTVRDQEVWSQAAKPGIQTKVFQKFHITLKAQIKVDSPNALAKAG